MTVGLSGARGAPHRWRYYYYCRLTAYEGISRDGTPPLVATGVRSPCGSNGAAFWCPGHSINWPRKGQVRPNRRHPISRCRPSCRDARVDSPRLRPSAIASLAVLANGNARAHIDQSTCGVCPDAVAKGCCPPPCDSFRSEWRYCARRRRRGLLLTLQRSIARPCPCTKTKHALSRQPHDTMPSGRARAAHRRRSERAEE